MAKFKPINLLQFTATTPTPINLGPVSISLLLDPASYAWTWSAFNYSTGLGNNTNTASSPVSVFGTRWRQLTGSQSNGTNTVMAGLDINGYAWTWGFGTYGQLGDGTNVSKSSPASVLGGRQWLSIVANQTLTVALDLNSYAWMWGYDSISYQSSPVSVAGNRQFIKILGGGADLTTTIALDSNSYAWTWGSASVGFTAGYFFGALGNNSTTATSSPVSVLGNHQWKSIVGGMYGSAYTHETFYGIDLNSYIWTWGAGVFGQLGNGTTMPGGVSSPVSVVGNRQFSKICSPPWNGNVYALDLNSYAWTWGGANNVGQMGNNTTTATAIYVSSPVSIFGGRQFTNIVAGYNDERWGVMSGSILWAWGNGAGLGNNTTQHQSSPMSIMSMAGIDFSTIVSSRQGSIMLPVPTLSQLWTWGNNNGDGTNNIPRSSPISINTTYLNKALPSSIYG